MSLIFKFIGAILENSNSWFGNAGNVIELLEKFFENIEG